MDVTFYVAAVVAVIATVMVITRTNAVHALLYLIVSLLSVALIFFTLGAPFIAALEVIVYAGAIMVLFVFVIMMLNLGPQSSEEEARWLSPGIWRGPALLAAMLGAELVYVLVTQDGNPLTRAESIEPKAVGLTLFGPYLLGVELASLLLMAGLVGAFHLGQRDQPADQKKGDA